MASSAVFDDSLDFVGHHTTPSGVSTDQNAYILNIHSPGGGYIDGMALTICKNQSIQIGEAKQESKSPTTTKRCLDDNPSCCAHLINHSKNLCNVHIISFSWSDVLSSISNADYKESFFDLPNVSRLDGSPRYILNSDIVYYMKKCKGSTASNLDSVCGAVACATRSIEQNNELFLDYGLQVPLPSWAVHWYGASQ
jgi:hypothetical protein